MNNDLDCLLHYTSSAPWLRETPGPAQVLYERFALNAGVPVDRSSTDFKRSQKRLLLRNGLAPFRAIPHHPMAALFSTITGKNKKAAAYMKAARFWFDYIRNARYRRNLYHQRMAQIESMVNVRFHLKLQKEKRKRPK